MHISKVSINNFRCVAGLELALNETTVIIGENNAGKSTVLDAVKIALSRRWGRAGQTGFHEYDFRPAAAADGGGYSGIQITLDFNEDPASPWDEDTVQDLNDIIRAAASNSICMRVNCEFEQVTKSLEPEWQFINLDGQPFSGKGARVQNLSNFFNYAPCFSMAALRDATTEFGSRSRFWGALLKSIEISPEKTAELEAGFEQLNAELLKADPKLEQIKKTLLGISAVIADGAAGAVDVRAVPTNLWDIISRSELLIQGKSTDPWLPVARHGQGVQSLAVIFLFRAFIENMLAIQTTGAATPILTLEEPEAHLHPQACRALYKVISELPGQKIVTTHSPYFVQNVPFGDLVILRRSPSGPMVSRLRDQFSCQVPSNALLTAYVAANPAKFTYDNLQSRLTVNGTIAEDQARALMRCYVAAEERQHHATIRALQRESEKYIEPATVQRLESWAKRIRGEIFFARKWILCEGQAEYALLGAIAEKLGHGLDAHGISVIDYQNNGSPGAFARLARALDFEWSMICDGDGGGNEHIQQLRTASFSQQEIDDRVIQLQAGHDLEGMILASALKPLFVAAIHEIDPTIAIDDAALLGFAGENKEVVAVHLAGQIRRSVDLAIPDEFKRLFAVLEDDDVPEE